MRKFGCSVFLAVFLAGVCSMAAAQAGYDIKVMTPQVEAALQARKARFAELKAIKGQGVVGENNRGYVEVFDGGGILVKELVTAENANRKELYQAIVEQNDLGVKAMSTVEGVFAGVQRDKAAVGEKIQEPSGRWVTK